MFIHPWNRLDLKAVAQFARGKQMQSLARVQCKQLFCKFQNSLIGWNNSTNYLSTLLVKACFPCSHHHHLWFLPENLNLNLIQNHRFPGGTLHRIAKSEKYWYSQEQGKVNPSIHCSKCSTHKETLLNLINFK